MAPVSAVNMIERAHQMYRKGKYEETLVFCTDALCLAKSKRRKIALHSNCAACFLKLYRFNKIKLSSTLNFKVKSMDISDQTPNSGHQLSPEKHIFILSGQSNMAGRGGVYHHHWDGVVPPECSPNPSIHRFTADLKWVPASEPLHADIDSKKVCGVGPGMSFANVVKDVVGQVGLVPCAVGGTAIREWARGCHLYENMIKRAKAAVACGDGRIRAMLWYQGESDAVSKHCVDTYKGNMEKLIDNVRHDLGLPNLPIIQVAIASGDKNYIEKIREIQKAIDVENVVCVDAKGLGLKEDNLHLTTEACVQLGQMLAQAYLTHLNPSNYN